MNKINDLNATQLKAFRSLEKAYKRCLKTGIHFENRYGHLHAYDGKKVIRLIDYIDLSRNPIDNVVGVLDARGVEQCFEIANEWCDDDSFHYLKLTDYGMKLL